MYVLSRNTKPRDISNVATVANVKNIDNVENVENVDNTLGSEITKIPDTLSDLEMFALASSVNRTLAIALATKSTLPRLPKEADA